jgi:hypothetical protein
MPRYEFMCETCKKPFELLLTISERAAARRLHGADVEEELRLRVGKAVPG